MDILFSAAGKAVDTLGLSVIADASEEEASSLLLEEVDVGKGELADLGDHEPLIGRVCEGE